MPRDRQLVDAVVELLGEDAIDTDDGTIITQVCARARTLLEADSACGVLLDPGAAPRLVVGEPGGAVAATLLTRHHGEPASPWSEAVAARQQVLSTDLAHDAHRWPELVADATSRGMGALRVVPLAGQATVLGSLTLLWREPLLAERAQADEPLAAALAGFAAFALERRRSVERAEQRAGHLERALDSRIAIEQAKGMIAERHGISVDEAFAVLRTHARRNNQVLHQLAGRIVRREVDIGELGRP